MPSKGYANIGGGTPVVNFTTFYEQLLREQIPKGQKNIEINQLFALLGSARVKAARKHIDEIDPPPWLV